MKINLERPLVTFDLEGTGTDPINDKIVQIAMVKLHPDGTMEELDMLINPGRPIPAGATAIHNITNEMVVDAPVFYKVAGQIMEFINGSDLAGYNCLMYDVPLLFTELAAAGVNWDHRSVNIVDAGNIFKIMQPRTLAAAVKTYCGVDLDGAHNALNDTRATLQVLIGQLNVHPDLPGNISDLALHSSYGKKRADATGKFVIDSDGDYAFNFGQYKSQKAKNNISYLHWMLQKSFPSDVDSICFEVINAPKKSFTTTDELPF